MTPARICPHCHLETDDAICPADGYQTVLAERYAADEVSRLVDTVFHGRYRVEACIGEGGMGAVYRAVQLSVSRPVALKVLRADYARNLEQVGRFQREARAASALEHPNTIRVYDFGQAEDGALYLALELLEGEPLSELLARMGRLPVSRAIKITIQILKSLSEAHTRGIVHRDLKPENIFMKRVHGEEDFVKVLDFGIAKVGETTEQSRSLTTTGTVVGTPLYMSPEQARGLDVGPASDLYSLGGVLYEMLAGHPPFDGDSAMTVMMAHVQNPVPRLPPDVRAEHPELERLVLRCLAKDPRKRPRSADSLRQALEKLTTGAVPVVEPAVDERRVSQPRFQPPKDTSHPAAVTQETLRILVGARRRRVAAFLMVVLLGGGAGAYYYLNRSVPAPTPEGEPPSTPVPSEGTASPVVGAPASEGVSAQTGAGRPSEAEETRRERRIPEVAAVTVRRHSGGTRPATRRTPKRVEPSPTLRVKKQ